MRDLWMAGEDAKGHSFQEGQGMLILVHEECGGLLVSALRDNDLLFCPRCHQSLRISDPSVKQDELEEEWAGA